MAGVARYGDPIPDATLDSIKRTKLALKGPLETPVGEGYRSINVALRKTFDLYANVRPGVLDRAGRTVSRISTSCSIRENTEGLYVGIEHYIRVGDDPRAAAESIAIITRGGSERIVRYAFEYAVKHNRKKVTLVHKANILKFSQGLFLDTGRMVAREYAGTIEFEERIVDAMAMNLVLHPGAVRRHRDDEPVRRHPVRSDLRAGRRARARAGREHRRRTARSSRRCTARRRTSRARASPIRARSCSRVHDARAHRRHRPRASASARALEDDDPRGQDGDARPRRHGDAPTQFTDADHRRSCDA